MFCCWSEWKSLSVFSKNFQKKHSQSLFHSEFIMHEIKLNIHQLQKESHQWITWIEVWWSKTFWRREGSVGWQQDCRIHQISMIIAISTWIFEYIYDNNNNNNNKWQLIKDNNMITWKYHYNTMKYVAITTMKTFIICYYYLDEATTLFRILLFFSTYELSHISPFKY